MTNSLEFDSDFDMVLAEAKYKKTLDEFEGVKVWYSGLDSQKDLSEEDKKILVNCRNSLLSLGEEEIVKGQFVRARGSEGNLEETLRYRIGELNMKISEYLINFQGSKKERFWMGAYREHAPNISHV